MCSVHQSWVKNDCRIQSRHTLQVVCGRSCSAAHVTMTTTLKYNQTLICFVWDTTQGNSECINQSFCLCMFFSFHKETLLFKYWSVTLRFDRFVTCQNGGKFELSYFVDTFKVIIFISRWHCTFQLKQTIRQLFFCISVVFYSHNLPLKSNEHVYFDFMSTLLWGSSNQYRNIGD